MKDKVVMTGNIENFTRMVEALMNKPDRVDRMGLAFGRWGLGKTTSVHYFHANYPCFYVRSWAAWSRSPNMMVEDLLKCYRVEARLRLKLDLRELVRVVTRNRAPLFIDEADRVVRKSILIETIRDLHDLTRVPIILIGQENILNLLQRKDLGQVLSRITETVEFKPLSAASIQDISKELCSLDCSAKVASFMRDVTLGDFRLVNTILTRVESLCSINNTSEISLDAAKEASISLPGSDDISMLPETRNEEAKGRKVLAVVA